MGANELTQPKGVIEKLRYYWSQGGIVPRPGAPATEIESFEQHYGVVLPPDLRAYFTTFDGMEYGEMDENCFSFLPLHLVKAIPEELAQFRGIPDYGEIMRTLDDPHCYFVIVDFLICSAAYAIRLSKTDDNNPVLGIGSGTDHRIMASSFSDFLEVYLASPNDLWI
jgi:hypothetical protein